MQTYTQSLSTNPDSCNQLNHIVISIALTAIVNQDLDLLKQLGIDRDQANLLGKLKATSLANVASQARGPLFEIAPKKIFQSLIDSASAYEDAEGKITSLIAIGASQPMLADLGFGITRPEFKYYVQTFGKQNQRGRPRRLRRKQIEQCHAFWSSSKRGETLSDPLNLLIETCEVFDIRACQLWEYLGPEGPRTPEILRQYSLNTPAEKRPWVSIMFKGQYVPNGCLK